MADAKALFSDSYQEPTEVDWLNFEKLLGISSESSLPPQQQQQLSSSSSSGTPEFENLYVLTSFYDPEDFTSGYKLYHIDDVNSNSASSDSHPQPLEHILYWDDDLHDPFHASLIFRSKLYMFGGMGFCWTNRMSTYDMERALSSSTTPTHLDVDSLVPGPQMNGRKCYPAAVPIGDSKICVFGTLLYFPGQVSQFSAPYFELFDTVKCTWKSLDEPMEYEGREPIDILSYCVRRSCLIIHTSNGIYGINLINVDNTDPEWVRLDRSERFLGFPLNGKWSMVDNNLCSPFNVKKQGDPKFYPFAPKALAFPDRESLIKTRPRGVICRGGVDDRCIDLCIVRTGFPYGCGIPSLLIDIIKFDNDARSKFGSDLSKWKEFESHKSITFKLTCSPCFHFEVIDCFPIKDALESRAHSNKRFASSHTLGTKDIPFDAKTQGRFHVLKCV